MIKIAPSILPADFANLERDIRRIDTSTATGKLERQREGKYKGRKAVTVPDLPRHYERWQRREVRQGRPCAGIGDFPAYAG